jgi:hypothetical protein
VEYAWDGRTLWLRAEIVERVELRLEFNKVLGKDHQS